MKIPPALVRNVCYLFIVLFTSSCVSRKEIVYFQNKDLLKSENRSSSNNVEIKSDDVLTIRVSAPEQDAALPFNLTKSLNSQVGMGGNAELESYVVSNNGTIEFPVIGTVEVKGLTTTELSDKIKNSISQYVKDPIVNVRILNFQISVLGEVNNPGTFSIEDDHINLSKALALAGDLTIFGKRNNILIMAEEDGEITYTYLDITNANVVDSPYYNLRQNDVIYVEPISTRRQSAGSTGIASTYLSLASVVASLIILLTR